MNQNSASNRFDTAAVAKGAATAILLAMAIGFSVGLFAFPLAFATDISAEAISNSIALHVVGFAVSILPDLIGGFVAARAAGHDELKHAFATGLVLLIFDGLLQLAFSDSALTWTDGAYFLLIVPMTVLGGYFGSAGKV